MLAPYIAAMTDEPVNGPIERPGKSPKNQTLRRVAKAAAGSVPGAGAVLAEIADACIPDHEAHDRSRWEGEITDGVNDLHGRVGEIEASEDERTVSFEGASALIAKFMIERCQDGLMQDRVTLADVQDAYPELAKEQLLDGFGELESYGLIESRALINAPTRYRLTEYAYQAFDGPIMGWNTEADAKAIAASVVRQRASIRTSDLEAELGWPRRRLNPALRMVVNFIDSGRVGQSIQPDYVTRYFSPNNAELAQLRRFAAGG